MNGHLVAREELTRAQADAMFDLLGAHFAGVSRTQFERDLAEKNWVLLLEDGAGDLAGFSTILFYDTVHDGERCPSSTPATRSCRHRTGTALRCHDHGFVR